MATQKLALLYLKPSATICSSCIPLLRKKRSLIPHAYMYMYMYTGLDVMQAEWNENGMQNGTEDGARIPFRKNARTVEP